MTEEFDTARATGRLMLTMLSGFATHEREVIRERSVAGTRRVAEAGVWLGGIVPYGYRRVGEKRDARIIACVRQETSCMKTSFFRGAAVTQMEECAGAGSTQDPPKNQPSAMSGCVSSQSRSLPRGQSWITRPPPSVRVAIRNDHANVTSQPQGSRTESPREFGPLAATASRFRATAANCGDPKPRDIALIAG